MSWPIRWIVWRSGPKILTDRKSTRLNSSHSQISYAVFCLKKKKKTNILQTHHPWHLPSDCAIVLASWLLCVVIIDSPLARFLLYRHQVETVDCSDYASSAY